MSDTSKATSKKTEAHAQRSLTGKKTTFNVIKEVWMPIVGAILGFCFGIAQDVIKHEYEYRMTTPQVRFSETETTPIQKDGKWEEEMTTRVRCVSRAEVPSMVVRAQPIDPDHITITGMVPLKEPSYSPPEAVGAPSPDDPRQYPPNIKTIRITKLHAPQVVVWKVKAESSTPFKGKPVQFLYAGIDSALTDIKDDGSVGWAEQISTPFFMAILFSYSVFVTLAIFLIYAIRRRNRKGG